MSTSHYQEDGAQTEYKRLSGIGAPGIRTQELQDPYAGLVQGASVCEGTTNMSKTPTFDRTRSRTLHRTSICTDRDQPCSWEEIMLTYVM